MRLVFKQKESKAFSLHALSEFHRIANSICETSYVVTSSKDFTEIRLLKNHRAPNTIEVLLIVELISNEEQMLNLAKEKWKVIGEKYNWILAGIEKGNVEPTSSIEIQLNNVYWAEDDRWTTERFRELIPQQFSDFYESRNLTQRLCELGIDLMNLVEEESLELTYKFNKFYFAHYFKNRRVFGINMFGNPKLAVWLPANVFADCNSRFFDNHYSYNYFDSHRCGVYPVQVTVADIEDLLEFAYSWHVELLS